MAEKYSESILLNEDPRIIERLDMIAAQMSEASAMKVSRSAVIRLAIRRFLMAGVPASGNIHDVTDEAARAA